jgi:S-adenosylmethionine-diacylgycerolhomoserine-N-methlytransferase
MNGMYRHQRHIYDATRKWYLIGRDRLIDDLRPGHGDAILEIGCGTGRNLVLAARRYPDARLFGIDVSTEMLTSAIRAIDLSGLSPRVRVAHADATKFDSAALFRRPRFERIMMSYCLSMIPAWGDVLETAISLLAPGGRLHIVDFGCQEGLPRSCRTALRAWLKLFGVLPRDELETALAALCGRAGASLTIRRPYFGYAQYAIVTLAERAAGRREAT